jgi:TP901 family phage tail tape measure protein
MPATVRDILLMIRAKEDATRSLSRLAGSMRGTAAAADAASARARAAQLRNMAAQARLSGASRAQVAAIHAQARAYDEQARSIETSTKRSKAFSGALSDVGSIAQTTGLVLLGMGAGGVLGMKKAIDVAAEWQRQVRLTFTQVDKRYKPSLMELSNIGLRVSKDIAVPFEQIQGALFDVFSSTEANMPQAEALLRSFAKGAVAGQTDIQTASRATIGLMNAFDVPLKDVNKVLDIQFQLVQEGVGTYEEWAGKIGNVTPSAVRAGQSMETMAAALATATRQGMTTARASTSVARAFDAMSNPKTEANLKKIGVATRDAKGNFRPMVDVLADWRKQLDKMPKADRVKAILDVLKGAGGTIEARRFLQNILLSKGGLQLFQDQIKEFATDKGAFERAYTDMANTAAAKSQLLHNAWMQLKLGIGNALLPTFIKFVGIIQKVVDAFNKLPTPVKQTIANVILFGTVLAGASGVVTLIVGALASLAGVIAAAGSAFLPMVGIFAGIIAVMATVVAGIVGLGAALVMAYRSSAPFRALLQSIWQTILTATGIIRQFAAQVWSSFQAQVLPALRNLWAVINAQVLPAVKQFVDWFRAQLVPVMKTAGGIIMGQVRPAFAQIAAVINAQIVPALKQLVGWWNAHKAAILPVIKYVMLFAAVVAGQLIGSIFTCIAALIKFIGFIVKVGSVLGSFLMMNIRMAISAFRSLRGAVSSVIGFFGSLGAAVRSRMSQAKAYVVQAVNGIKAYFSGAAGWLVGAGANIVRGLINGIRGMVGQAAREAANLASSVLHSAMGALGIHSPSTKFKDIGVNIVRGLINGVKNSATQKQLQNAMFALTRDVQRSINGADIGRSAKRSMMARWNAKLASTNKKLGALENKRLVLQNKLTAATKSYNDQLKTRNDLAAKVSEALAASADISTLDDTQKTSTAGMIKGLQDRLAAMKTFKANLTLLAKRGLDKQTIADLAGQGVDAAGAMVQTLANGSELDLKNITLLQQEIRKLAGDTGTKVAGDLYNAGINAAKGLIAGLNSQISQITKQMTAIATALIKEIKKQLGIKSPSTVFADIGGHTAQGYINGYMSKMRAGITKMAGAANFGDMLGIQNPAVGRGRGMSTQPYGGTIVYRTYDIKQTINTQEINPVKTAADLGWELAGRIS